MLYLHSWYGDGYVGSFDTVSAFRPGFAPAIVKPVPAVAQGGRVDDR
jgi:hypothetical protein